MNKKITNMVNEKDIDKKLQKIISLYNEYATKRMHKQQAFVISEFLINIWPKYVNKINIDALAFANIILSNSYNDTFAEEVININISFIQNYKINDLIRYELYCYTKIIINNYDYFISRISNSFYHTYTFDKLCEKYINLKLIKEKVRAPILELVTSSAINSADKYLLKSLFPKEFERLMKIYNIANDWFIEPKIVKDLNIKKRASLFHKLLRIHLLEDIGTFYLTKGQKWSTEFNYLLEKYEFIYKHSRDLKNKSKIFLERELIMLDSFAEQIIFIIIQNIDEYKVSINKIDPRLLFESEIITEILNNDEIDNQYKTMIYSILLQAHSFWTHFDHGAKSRKESNRNIIYHRIPIEISKEEILKEIYQKLRISTSLILNTFKFLTLSSFKKEKSQFNTIWRSVNKQDEAQRK